MSAFTLRLTASVTVFSSVPPGPSVPLASPPWPGSSTTVRTPTGSPRIAERRQRRAGVSAAGAAPGGVPGAGAGSPARRAGAAAPAWPASGVSAPGGSRSTTSRRRAGVHRLGRGAIGREARPGHQHQRRRRVARPDGLQEALRRHRRQRRRRARRRRRSRRVGRRRPTTVASVAGEISNTICAELLPNSPRTSTRGTRRSPRTSSRPARRYSIRCSSSSASARVTNSGVTNIRPSWRSGGAASDTSRPCTDTTVRSGVSTAERWPRGHGGGAGGAVVAHREAERRRPPRRGRGTRRC